MDPITYLPALAGGVLIGLAALGAMFLHGRIAGISGIVGGLLRRPFTDIGWRVTFVVGLLVGGLAVFIVDAGAFSNTAQRPLLVTALAGLLVGFGTRLGSGCTSGHGICGISRFSSRSIVATVTFMAAGAATAAIVTHAFGGAV